MNVSSIGTLVLVLSLSQSAAAVSIWGKIKNAFNDCSYSEQEHQQVYNFEIQMTPRLTENYAGRFSEQDFSDKSWMRDFRYVIVVNKAAYGSLAQTMRVYDNGILIHQTKVSTGRENFELRRKNKVCSGAPPKSYWSQTPTGFYTPKYLSKDHKSSSWDSDMPFAIFFDVENGLALHQVHWKYKDYLGNRASGGCIRQDQETAENLFNLVEKTRGAMVPDVNRDGTPVLDENGQVKYVNKQFWINPYTGEQVRFDTFSVLIIVEDAS